MFLSNFKRLSVIVFYGSDLLNLENVARAVNSIFIFILNVSFYCLSFSPAAHFHFILVEISPNRSKPLPVIRLSVFQCDD